MNKLTMTLILSAILISQTSFATCTKQYWDRNTRLLLTSKEVPELTKSELKKSKGPTDMVSQYLLVAGEIVNAEGGYVSDSILKDEVIKNLRSAGVSEKKWS